MEYWKRRHFLFSCGRFHQAVASATSIGVAGGSGVFVSVQQNNNNTRHTNPNCKIVQYGKNIMYYMMVLQNSTKVTYYENVPIKNLQKNVDIKIEDSHPYRAELVQNIPQNRISDKKLYTKFCLGVVLLLFKYWINIFINYITNISIQIATLSLILVTVCLGSTDNYTLGKLSRQKNGAGAPSDHPAL